MISPFLLHNLIGISIPFQISSLFLSKKASFLLLLIFSFQAFTFAFENPKKPEPETMRIHPLPMKRNITIQYEMNPRTTRSQAETLLNSVSNKKLRRLPHVFSRVLELPFRSDADVSIEESADCFKFVAETDWRIGDVVRAHTVEIHPGVTKIVIRSNNSVGFGLQLDELELDMWRFRLPETTIPELASAVYEDGELIVTVPKREELRGGMGNGNSNSNSNNNNRLVLVH